MSGLARPSTALLFTVGKFAIGFYLGKAGVTSGFGAAGSIVVLLVWVYYSSQTVSLRGRVHLGLRPQPRFARRRAAEVLNEPVPSLGSRLSKPPRAARTLQPGQPRSM